MARQTIGTTTGNALQFNGSSQYAKRSTVVSTATDNFTFGGWIQMVALPAATNSAIQNGCDGGSGAGYYVGFKTDGTIHATYGFVVARDSVQVAVAGTWYHVVVQRNGGTSQIYVNGATSGGTWANAPFAPDVGTTVGAGLDSGGTATKFANCKVDDARFYERVLSVGEITNWYNLATNPNNADISSSNLVAWYKFNETSGTSAADSSGNSRTLTATGSPSWVTGKVQISSIPARSVAGVRTLAGTRTIAS